MNPHRMKIIYVAHKYRDTSPFKTLENVQLASCLAADIWKAGHAAICPGRNTLFMDGLAPDENFLAGDLEIITRCDAVLMDPSWTNSEGAKKEQDFALNRGIPVFYAEDPASMQLFQKFLAGEFRLVGTCRCDDPSRSPRVEVNSYVESPKEPYSQKACFNDVKTEDESEPNPDYRTPVSIGFCSIFRGDWLSLNTNKPAHWELSKYVFIADAQENLHDVYLLNHSEAALTKGFRNTVIRIAQLVSRRPNAKIIIYTSAPRLAVDAVRDEVEKRTGYRVGFAPAGDFAYLRNEVEHMMASEADEGRTLRRAVFVGPKEKPTPELIQWAADRDIILVQYDKLIDVGGVVHLVFLKVTSDMWSEEVKTRAISRQIFLFHSLFPKARVALYSADLPGDTLRTIAAHVQDRTKGEWIPTVIANSLADAQREMERL